MMTANQQALLDRIQDPLFNAMLPENIAITRAAFPLALDSVIYVMSGHHQELVSVTAIGTHDGRLVVTWLSSTGASGYQFTQPIVPVPAPTRWQRFCQAVKSILKAVVP